MPELFFKATGVSFLRSFLAFALLAGAWRAGLSICAQAAEPADLIVQFRENATAAQAAQTLRRGGVQLRGEVRTPAMSRRGRLRRGLSVVSAGGNPVESLRRLRNDPAVAHAEPNYKYRLRAVANDTYFKAGYQWGLYGAATSPSNSFGIGAAQAWRNGFVGTNKVYVGVIDEGVQIAHPDLRPNVWTNAFETLDGLDNDGNGYVDDLHGWDFHHETNEVYVAGTDDHGTHVAGTIGARGGDGLGVAGVNWNVTIVTAKFIVDGEGSTLDALEAIDYLVDLKERHGLNIVAINASWGGEGYSRFLHEAIIRAAKAGILFVAAAGNDGLNNDVSPSYPCNLATDVGTAGETAASYNAVISVAAIDKQGALASFSNYGAASVHIGAPGVEVLSVYPDAWAYFNGTSMAAPHVTGAAALYASTHPRASAAEIRAALLGAAAATPSLSGKTTSGARLNIAQAINPPAPAAPLDLELTAEDKRMVLRWGAVEGAQSYVVKRALGPSSTYSVLQSGLGTNVFLDTAVTHDQEYFYRVAASNVSGQSADSAAVGLRAVAQAPAAPDYVRANAGTNQVELSWPEVRSAAGYLVKRGASAGGPFQEISAVTPGCSFVDSDASLAGAGFYVVTALNASGESTNSPVVAARVLPAVAGADAWADGDGDGFGDLEEALLQTDPADPLSALRFESVEQAGSELRLSFPAAPGREYVVERNDDFPAGRWDESARFVAAQTREVFTDAASGTTRRAYRVRAADYLPAKASEAAGFMRKTLSGHSDTLLSLPFTRVPEARGTVAAVQGSRVWIEAGTDWAPGRWVYAEGSQTNTYYLHIQTGAAAGGWHTITNSDAGSVTLSLGAATLARLAAGDQVTIVPHWTIGSVFPGGNGVHTAPRPSSRPTELLFPKFEPVQINSAPASTYYFRNGIWQKVSSGLTNQGDVIIPPDRYILVRQNTNAATALVLHGMVGAARWRISVGRSAGGSVDNHFALPRPHASTLNDSGLFESGAFRSSSRPGSRADELLVYNLDLGGYNASPAATYYHYLGSWRRVGGGMTDFGEEPMLQPGYGFILRSTASPESPAWSIPASY